MTFNGTGGTATNYGAIGAGANVVFDGTSSNDATVTVNGGTVTFQGSSVNHGTLTGGRVSFVATPGGAVNKAPIGGGWVSFDATSAYATLNASGVIIPSGGMVSFNNGGSWLIPTILLPTRAQVVTAALTPWADSSYGQGLHGTATGGRGLAFNLSKG